MISVDEIIQKMTLVDSGDCPYLEGHKERILAISCPGLPNELHAPLIERGFRHSGDIFYSTQCEHCDRCIPMRIDPTTFHPSKKQRHILHKNADVEILIGAPIPTKDDYDLYQRYMAYQHPDSTQDTSYRTLMTLFYAFPSTAILRYMLHGKMIGLSIIDVIPQKAFSSVYHMFDPDYAKRSVGVFSMLAEISMTYTLKIPYYYPGLWVPDCPKMQYKANYRPNQLLINGKWIDHA